MTAAANDPTIDAERVERIAQALVDARNTSTPLPVPSGDLVAASAAEACAIDDRVAAVSGWQLKGWKIGATNEVAQEILGADGPFAGRVYDIDHGDTTLGSDEMGASPYLEGEFAFTMGHALHPARELWTRDEVVLSIASVHTAIEVVGGRYETFIGVPLNAVIGDAGTNRRLVLGPAVLEFDDRVLPKAAATLAIDGTVVGEGTGEAVLGDPIIALMWLADHLSSRGISIEAGEVVTTGTATGIAPFEPGSTATATIDGLGAVTLKHS